ncbi:bifunctional ADP-dependent NAD(P)H-hydrate dehydratase/NAD(P)H-hydrate epimerase [Methanosarcinales archaeon]|nr:MAG: bifunctional ADP-dependent NAD(P)H-hydrate dehydratase/NAD(P)H-hydrate epimerase [Methanosarcinales archaeon]
MSGRDEITSEEMAALDENCKAFGISPLQLMENAGAAVAREIFNAVERKRRNPRVLIVAGRGNNGGDGFVAARHLLSRGCDVHVILIGRGEEDIRTEEARYNYRILKACGCEVDNTGDALLLGRRFHEITDEGVDVIVDAIFGTGFRGVAREPEATAIASINSARERGKCIVVAVDVPSGLDADSGDGTAVRADITVTFHKVKPGLRIAKEIVGKLVTAPIGIPPFFEKLAGPGDVRIALKKRRPDSHKGENGRVLVVGGGPFAGAPALAALSALRAGADWVTVASPRSVAGTIAGFSPDMIVQPLSSDILMEEDTETIANLAKKHDVMLIGSGLGDDEETKNAVTAILKRVNGKIVVDADGFYGVAHFISSDVHRDSGLSQDSDLSSKNVILTPHAGEFFKMGISFSARTQEERESFVRNFSARNGVVTLLKGNVDIISDGERLKINRTGNAGMTVGGTGDVLAGILAAFFAVNDDAFRVSVAASYVSGAAGDIAFEEKGNCLIATDVIACIPKVLMHLSTTSQ